jgi:hypothetical protein
MSENSLSTLQIRLLFRCCDKAMSKTDVYRFSKKLSTDERAAFLHPLIQSGLLTEQEMPKKGVHKVPIFYFITDAGKAWVKQYQKNYPQ